MDLLEKERIKVKENLELKIKKYIKKKNDK